MADRTAVDAVNWEYSSVGLAALPLQDRGRGFESLCSHTMKTLGSKRIFKLFIIVKE